MQFPHELLLLKRGLDTNCRILDRSRNTFSNESDDRHVNAAAFKRAERFKDRLLGTLPLVKIGCNDGEANVALCNPILDGPFQLGFAQRDRVIALVLVEREHDFMPLGFLRVIQGRGKITRLNRDRGDRIRAAIVNKGSPPGQPAFTRASPAGFDVSLEHTGVYDPSLGALDGLLACGKKLSEGQ